MSKKRSGSRGRAGSGAPSGARFVDIGGSTIVILEEEEYERLLDKADAADAIRIKKDDSDPVLSWDDARKRLIRNRIAEVRTKLGISQRELAKRLKVKPSTVSRWEREDANLTLETLRKIAAALKTDVHELIS